MDKPKMYAKCLNVDCVNVERNLEERKEYRVMKVKTFPFFGDELFYILEDGYAYASYHFTTTYLK